MKTKIKRKLKGVVVSDKMDKTCTVAVERFKKHPRYGKIYRLTKKFKAHDPQNECKQGQEVIIEETFPISKEKRWKVVHEKIQDKE